MFTLLCNVYIFIFAPILVEVVVVEYSSRIENKPQLLPNSNIPLRLLVEDGIIRLNAWT